MNSEKLRLVKPSMEFEAEYRAMIAEFQEVDGDRRLGYNLKEIPDDFAEMVRRFENEEQGIELAPGLVPQTTFWLVDHGGRLLGECRLRHRLTPMLEQRGGHIGYAIRPSERRKGRGTMILALAIEEAKALGVTRAIVTCHPANTASARIIVKNGGVKDADGVSPETGEPTSRYWISL